MAEKSYTKAETQAIANQIRKQILGIALKLSLIHISAMSLGCPPATGWSSCWATKP